eukprot:TRINITY_DN17385_c0_g1_i2.p1 TRINITY_DN17385_c0_g1~~TRINITY_DN17385_c0_g1_i2.p1  ORF type:complete len:316 (-),score=62.76 TRINITY_DN17385_c0_g1_i2:14-961(-)
MAFPVESAAFARRSEAVHYLGAAAPKRRRTAEAATISVPKSNKELLKAVIQLVKSLDDVAAEDARAAAAEQRVEAAIMAASSHDCRPRPSTDNAERVAGVATRTARLVWRGVATFRLMHLQSLEATRGLTPLKWGWADASLVDFHLFDCRHFCGECVLVTEPRKASRILRDCLRELKIGSTAQILEGLAAQGVGPRGLTEIIDERPVDVPLAPAGADTPWLSEACPEEGLGEMTATATMDLTPRGMAGFGPRRSPEGGVAAADETAAAAAAAAEVPRAQMVTPPPGWALKASARKREKYWVNTRTGETTWLLHLN